MDTTKNIRVTLSFQSIINVVLAAVLLWVVYQIRDVIVLFLTVVAIVITFSPIVKSWEKHMPRGLAILLLYLIVLLITTLITALILPPVLSQISDFLIFIQSTAFDSIGTTTGQSITSFRDSLLLLSQGRGFELVSQLFNQFQGSLSAVFSGTVGFFGNVVAVVTVFIASFYLLLEENSFYQFLGTLLPSHRLKQVTDVMDRISQKMMSWLMSQFILMLIVGTLVSIALGILGVPYALLLGVWAGVMEFLPYVGPIAGMIPGIFLAFTTLGFVKGIIAIVIYLAIQQIENQFLVPKIMGKALGLSPVVIIFSLLIGGKLLGFIGLLIAIPIAAALSVIFEEWRKPAHAK